MQYKLYECTRYRVVHPPVPIAPHLSACSASSSHTHLRRLSSPAEDLGAERIDLSKVLITHPQATFLQRVSGHSMKARRNSFDGDVLVIDRAIKPSAQDDRGGCSGR